MFGPDLLVTLVIIFLVALFGSYMRRALKDRCLTDFHEFQVTVEKTNGRIIWGILHLESTGMELEYTSNVEDAAHIETSYLLYKDEYKDIQGIYRYVDELTMDKTRRRERDLARSFHPGPVRVLQRKLRNTINTTADSLSEAVGVIAGRAKKPAAQYLSDTGETYLKKLGKDIIGYVGTSFDPLLEEHVGAKVVVEVLEDGSVHEHVGILKEYSAQFLELLDVLYPQSLSLNLETTEKQADLAKDIQVSFRDGAFHVVNHSAFPLLLHRIRCNDRQGEVNAVIGPGDEIKLQAIEMQDAQTPEHSEVSVFFEGASQAEEDAFERSSTGQTCLLDILEDLDCGETDVKNMHFDFRLIRLLDMIVPREHALVRHKAERYDPDQVFGEIAIGRPKSRDDRDLKEEYRATLRRKPQDAAKALGLARLLMQEGDYEEAKTMLKLALENKQRLVDHGRLAELQLAFVNKRLEALQQTLRN